jgi:hypothetical protein
MAHPFVNFKHGLLQDVGDHHDLMIAWRSAWRLVQSIANRTTLLPGCHAAPDLLIICYRVRLCDFVPFLLRQGKRLSFA